ncbi:MAG: SHOCT domain-containing protein [Acidimicrobiia bacterium]
MTFWELFVILLIFVPLIMLWVFTLVDLFQRPDLSGVAKALWALAIVLLPLIAMLIYFIMRDTDAADPGAPPVAAPPHPRPAPIPATPAAPAGAADVADQLDRLADLRDRGVLTDDEFQREKDKLLGYSPT